MSSDPNSPERLGAAIWFTLRAAAQQKHDPAVQKIYEAWVKRAEVERTRAK